MRQVHYTTVCVCVLGEDMFGLIFDFHNTLEEDQFSHEYVTLFLLREVREAISEGGMIS